MYAVRPKRFSSTTEVREFLSREVERQRQARLERSPYDTTELRSEDENAARRRACLVFGLTLPPVKRYAWEGWDPHDRDPAWPQLFARAVEQESWRWHHFLHPDAAAWETTPLPVRFYGLAADVAAAWLRALARTGPAATQAGSS